MMRSLFAALIMVLGTVVGCNSSALPSDEQTTHNESSKIIGETLLLIGSSAKYQLDADVEEAYEFNWSVPNDGIVSIDANPVSLTGKTIKLKGEKAGTIKLGLHYKVKGYLEAESKYITVTVKP